MDGMMRHSWFLATSGMDAFKSKRMFVAEVLAALLLFWFAVKTENFFARVVFDPLLKRLFGDGQELRDELNRKEREMQDAVK
ncbi:hypothetical protein BASA81_015752 [Batrachochytrium salamandrivorans]|nr:hypothetical protein BASA81_015752 [Batrachochytrium salamandrivorans]